MFIQTTWSLLDLGGVEHVQYSAEISMKLWSDLSLGKSKSDLMSPDLQQSLFLYLSRQFT